MGALIKGLILGTIGAVLAVPALFILAVFGIPLFIAGAVMFGVVVAVPMIILAALALPLFVVFAVFIALFLVAVVLALKVALFVVLPVLLVALAISWLVRTAHSRRDEHLYA